MRRIFTPNRIYPVVLIILVFAVWKIRQGASLKYVEFSGTTMGPIVYNVKYLEEDGTNYQAEVDSILIAFNQSLNTYNPSSEISNFNKGSSIRFTSPFFFPVLEKSKEVHRNSDGAFDPTVMPLVNAWGFGPDAGPLPDSAEVDSLLTFVGFEKVTFTNEMVSKSVGGLQLDFSAIAKGYGVDVVVEFLQSKGITNLMVEIGGELSTRGTNKDGNPWVVGIIDPNSIVLQPSIFATAQLEDQAIATSANNFNYIEKDGKKYVHTINPGTGYPVIHSLLSASVFAGDCMTADAYATAFMVLGVEKSMELVEQTDAIEAFLIFSDEEGGISVYKSPGLANSIKLQSPQ